MSSRGLPKRSIVTVEGSIMNSGFALLLVFGIGVVTGLRSMTAPAVVAWAARLGWISLHGSPLAFMGSAWAVGIFTLGALGEFVADQLPTTPPRTAALGADCPNCHWLAYGCMSRRRWGRVVLTRGADRGNRRNRWRIRWLSGSRQTGSRPSRSGRCGCHPGRPGCNWARTAAGYQILKFSEVVTKYQTKVFAKVFTHI